MEAGKNSRFGLAMVCNIVKQLDGGSEIDTLIRIYQSLLYIFQLLIEQSNQFKIAPQNEISDWI